MSISLPRGPYFVPPYKPATGGVDFLGLRQVNLDMMAACLPGINNVTFHIRPFSLLSWIHWKFHALALEAGIKDPSRSQFAAFSEKVETLFTWGHQLHGIAGVPGRESRPPASNNDRVTLSFSDWRRTAENTSLMAAVQYGPASKTTGGLGLLEPLEGGFHRVCGEGVALAETLDRSIVHRNAAQIVASLDADRATADEARDLFAAWRVDRPSKKERDAFRRVFFDPQRAADDSLIGRRSGTIQLILDFLSTAGGSTEGAIRRGLTYLHLGSGRAVEVRAHLSAARQRWFVLQVRQAQRLAFESLFAWLERRILDSGDRDSETMARAAVDTLADSDIGAADAETVESLRSSLGGEPRSLVAYCEDAASHEASDIFAWMARLQDAVTTAAEPILPLAIKLMMLTATIVGVIGDDKVVRNALRLGGAGRMSLSYWRETVGRCAEMDLRSFLVFVLENLILSQHFAVAAGRFDGTTQRLRVTIEEDGLKPLVLKPWEPALTPDRLASTLSLLSDCGMLASDASSGEYLLLIG